MKNKSARLKIQKITINGKKYTRTGSLSPFWFEFEDLLKIGAIRITECGAENMYFNVLDDDGANQAGFVKMF